MTFGMLTVAFGKSTMNRTQVQLWYNWLKKCRENVNDDDSSDYQSNSTIDENIEKVKKMIIVESVLAATSNDSTHAKQFLLMF